MRRFARVFLEVGIAAAVFGLSKLHAVRHVYSFTGSFRFGWAITYVLVLSVTAYAVGLPDLPPRRGKVVTALVATFSAALVVSFFQLFLGDALLPRLVVFGSAIVLVPWFVLCAGMAESGSERAGERDRVVVVGDADEGESLRIELDDAPEHPAVVVDALRVDETVGEAGDEPLVDRAITSDATVLVLSRAAQEDARVVEQASVLHEAGLRVRSLAAFYEEWLGKLPIPELERLSLMFDIGELHGTSYARVKRLLDLVLGIAGLVALVVLLPIVAIGNLFANRGPLFYRQARVGQYGREFTILKLRTMHAGEEATATEWTSEEDPRITRLGHALRRTHLDELPQVVNIVRGELSIVGPRPEQPRYVTELQQKIPFYDLRHLVRPGLTGWAQVKFGYAGDERDALEKLQYDFWYLRHQSLAVDCRILGRTVRDVSGGAGR